MKENLKSGKSNKKVTNPKQAVAIGLSEARKKALKFQRKVQKLHPKNLLQKKAPLLNQVPKKDPRKSDLERPLAKATFK